MDSISEYVFVTLDLSHRRKLLGTRICVSPNILSEIYESVSTVVEDTVISLSSPTSYLIVGDFNIPQVDWREAHSLCPTLQSQLVYQFSVGLDLTQFNHNVIVGLSYWTSYSQTQVSMWLKTPCLYYLCMCMT